MTRSHVIADPGRGTRPDSQVDYLRLSVTDRCNFRCVYCMPPEGVPFKPVEEILRYEEMAFFVRLATTVGISKIPSCSRPGETTRRSSASAPRPSSGLARPSPRRRR